MPTLAIALFVASIVLLWYAIWGRSWLKSKPWAQGFFAWIEPFEIAVFKKSETVLAARTLTGLGALLTFLTQLGDINLTPIMPFVPEQYQGIVTFAVNCLPLVISAIGWMVEKLRSKVTQPLELVAVPEAAKQLPAVAIAMADAQIAKETAVAVVKDRVV